MKRKASLRELRTTESPPNTASIATTQKNASPIEVADVAASSSLEDFSCSLCRETIKEAFMTSCGHSFCHACISAHCDQTGHCPSCNFVLSQNNLFPNFMLNKLIEKTTLRIAKKCDLSKYGLAALDKNDFSKRKGNIHLLLNFINSVKDSKSNILETVKADLAILETDISAIQSQIPCNNDTTSTDQNPSLLDTDSFDDSSFKLSPFNAKQYRRVKDHFNELQECYFDNVKDKLNAADSLEPKTGMTFNDTFFKFAQYSRLKTLANLHYADSFFNNSSSIVSSIEFDKDDEFFASAGVTRKIKIFEYANVVYNYRDSQDNEVEDNSITNSEHISEHEDSTNDDSVPAETNILGANDGVLKFPVQEISCKSKISCLSWNSYIKTQLLSTDYEGIVTLWDSSVGVESAKFDEHEKRAWSVDFSLINPMMFASGGDDTKVKIWSTNQSSAATTITTKANICSVRFNPRENHQIAFGSADHHVHYYDLRNITTPLSIVRGHRKAVSYVRFLNNNEMLSASTDCSLRLWDVKKSFTYTDINASISLSESRHISIKSDPKLLSSLEGHNENPLIRSYQGHLNEKNFVGLSVNCDGEYIACGSETNEVYVYMSKLAKPVAKYHFGNPVDALTGMTGLEEDPSMFVSSVCWMRSDPRVLVAANSQGRIKVLELA